MKPSPRADDTSRHASGSIACARRKLGNELTANWHAAFLVAYRVMHNDDASNEVLQDAACRALVHAGTFDWSRPVRPWFLRIVKNTALNEVRRRKHFCELPEIADTRSVAESLIREEERRALRAAVIHLPPKYREVVELRYGNELDYKEISRALHVPIGTTKTLLHRAHKAIRCRLSG